ncbi:MAG TPA: VTT domain-containing protein [Nitrosopumilaceae archaeon]|nr:VTT domain-containing protein [Nitrosopumilaceae archaeon]
MSLVSFFGSLIPFVPIPSFLVLATMSVGDQFNLHILAFLSAVTAAGAKQIIFYVSYSGRRMISEETKKRMKPFQKLVKRYGGGAAFIAAATPVPDDLVYIPLGLAKYNPKRFFVATLLGKIVLGYAIVLGSHFFGDALEPFLEQVDDPLTIYAGIIVFGAALTTIIVLMFRLDWRQILGKVAPWTLIDDEDENDSKKS